MGTGMMGRRPKVARSRGMMPMILALLMLPLGSFVGYQAALSACGVQQKGEREEATPLMLTRSPADNEGFKDPSNQMERVRLVGGMMCEDARPMRPRKDVWLFRNSNSTPYLHMPMLEQLSNGTLVAAWQTSESVEGAMSQHIEFSVNVDGQGEEWTTPTRLRLAFTGDLSKPRDTWEQKGGQWGPVLHNDGKGHLWLFYAESNAECIRPTADRYPKRYIIGGDIKVARLNLDSGKWSNPVVLYSQNVDNYIPKVTANKLVVLSTGEWVLPFWRERSASSCKSSKGTRTSAGVLITADQGRTWEGHAVLYHSHSWLIENTVVELANGDLIMYFRTSLGWVFHTRSLDKGQTWTNFEPITLPNPDSKIHALSLPSQNLVLIAFNDHPKFPAAWVKLRTHLRVALSQDEGYTWHRVVSISDDMRLGMRYAYPTMVLQGCSLYIIYSVTYEPCIAHCSSGEATDNEKKAPVELLPPDTAPALGDLGIRMSVYDLRELYRR